MSFVANVVFEGNNHTGQFACGTLLYFLLYALSLFQSLFAKYFKKCIEVFFLFYAPQIVAHQLG